MGDAGIGQGADLLVERVGGADVGEAVAGERWRRELKRPQADTPQGAHAGRQRFDCHRGRLVFVGRRALRISDSWLREVQRDVMALGSVVFYLLVLGRALVGPFWDLAVPLVVVGAVLAAASPLLKQTDLYLARGEILAVLVTRHYGNVVFGLFAATALMLMALFAYRLGRSGAAIARGLILGAGLSGVAYALAVWID